MDVLDHHIIDDLLAAGEGGEQLRRIGLQFREHLRGLGIDLPSLCFREEHEKRFGWVVEERSSCQQQVANTLRLMCGAEVLTEFAGNCGLTQ